MAVTCALWQSGGYLSGDAPSNRDDPESKAEIEHLTLQLDDVTSERNYLQKEIQKMKDYVAKMNEKLSDDEVTQIQVCNSKKIGVTTSV
jgi:hypothetical protein